MHTSASSNEALDFQAIFSATASPYLVLNPALIIVEVNDAYLVATARSRDELLGKYVFGAFPDNPNDLTACGVKNLQASLQRVLQHRVADRMAVQKYDIPIGSPANGQFQERYWSPVNTPVIGEDGDITHILHHVEDITQRVSSEAALRESERRFRALTNATADVIYRMSPDWKYMLELDGRGFLKDTSALGEYQIDDYVHPDDRMLARRAIDEAIRNKTVYELEHRVVRADGSYGWTHSRAVPLLDAKGEIQEWIGAASDITKRKQAEEKVRHASLHDSLTGLPNRAMLFEYAGRLLPHNLRVNTCAALLFLDLDRFKPINDTHGHETGDEVLKEVAGRLSRSLRAEDIIVRLGGDEFVILLQDIKNASYAGEVACHIVTKINEPYRIHDLALSLSTSVGISVFPGDGQDIDTLISHADTAMYQAKQVGRNNFQFYSAEFTANTKLQLAIEQQLRSALRCDDFHLCYQPVLDLENRHVVSVEALIRWSNADIGPEQFVPIAEATGIINPIGRWVLKEALRQHKAWLAEGFPAIPIAVNVSVVEFRDQDFVSRFERLLYEHGIEPTALQLELTETAVMDNIEHAIKVLSQLKAMGVTILLDDFGSGYSSLAHLARLPLNKIKIDKSFVSQLETDLASRAVTDAMLTLGHTLGLEVVAEGVESKFALDYLRTHGCRQAQGYLFSKPLSGEAFVAWCQHWQKKTQTAFFSSQQHRFEA